MTVVKHTLPDCVMVARQTLTLFVWVRILVRQPNDGSSFTAIFYRGVAQLVACCVRDAEAASSSLATPTIVALSKSVVVCHGTFWKT